MSTQALLSVEEVISALGGKAVVADLIGLSPNAVWNWCDRNYFPSNTYVVMTEALSAKGHTAPAALWSMKESAA